MFINKYVLKYIVQWEISLKQGNTALKFLDNAMTPFVVFEKKTPQDKAMPNRISVKRPRRV